MKNCYRDGKLTEEVIDTIMDEAKPNQKEKSPFRDTVKYLTRLKTVFQVRLR